MSNRSKIHDSQIHKFFTTINQDIEFQDLNNINNLNNLLQNTPEYDDFTQQIKNNVQILANGLNNLDQEVKQKTFEVKNREQLLVQRDNLLSQIWEKNPALAVRRFNI